MYQLSKATHELNLKKIRRPLLFACVGLTAILVLQCCASRSRSQTQMLRVLDAEADLLQKLTHERRSPGFSQTVQANPALAKAEEDLHVSIDALIRANAELRSAVRQQSSVASEDSHKGEDK